MHKNNLKFNFGYLLEASPGTSSLIEVDYPYLRVEDTDFKQIKGKFRATRTGEGIYIAGIFETKTDVKCVRCLTDAYVPVTMELGELFYYPPYTAPEGEYTIGVDGNADLGPLIRELSYLNLPMKPICREDCQGLCFECGQNLNLADCGCEADDIDPRLAALEQLFPDETGD